MAKEKQFPTYKPGQSCLQQGGKHAFVARPTGKGRICKKCGSVVSQASWERRKQKEE